MLNATFCCERQQNVVTVLPWRQYFSGGTQMFQHVKPTSNHNISEVHSAGQIFRLVTHLEQTFMTLDFAAPLKIPAQKFWTNTLWPKCCRCVAREQQYAVADERWAVRCAIRCSSQQNGKPAKEPRECNAPACYVSFFELFCIVGTRCEYFDLKGECRHPCTPLFYRA